MTKRQSAPKDHQSLIDALISKIVFLTKETIIRPNTYSGSDSDYKSNPPLQSEYNNI